MVRGRIAAVLIALAATGALAFRAPGDAGVGTADNARVELAVIVQADIPVTTLTRENVRRVFLLRARFWPGGERIAPVNLASGSALRDAFSRAVLGQSTRELRDYWNDLYFHGTLPPPTVESEAAMLLYVARTPGAIGYVSRDALAAAPAGVRVALTVEAGRSPTY